LGYNSFGATIFSENIGAGTGTTAINTYTGWQNNGILTFSGTGDVRNTTASSGYAGASGSGNVFLTNTSGTYFQISGINTSSYTALSVSFGIYKSTTASTGSELVLEVSSDGITYNPLAFTALSTGAGTAVWYLRTATGTIPSTANLRIRFRQTGTTPQFRIDDVNLTGTLSASPSLSVSPTSLTGFTYVVGSGPSVEQSYTLSGTGLTGYPANITVNAPTDYLVCLTSGGTFTTSVNVAYTSATLSSTTIFVKLKSGLSAANYNGENISNAGGGATTVNVSCSGSVTTTAISTYLIDEEFTSTTSDANLTSTTSGFTTSTSGWISNSSTVYNRRANCLRLTASGTITTPTFSNGDLLSFWIENISGTPSGNFDIQAYNGTWSTIGTITNISNIPQTYFYSIAAGVTQLRFNFTDGGNDVYFDDVMVRSSNKCSGTPPLIERVLVNSCNNSLEGRNELILVQTGSTSIDINNLFITFPAVTSGGYSFGSGCSKTFTTNATYTSALNTLAGCTIATEPPGGIVPANSKLVIFTGATPEFTYDFSNACGSSYYVIYCNNTETSGRFSNKPSGGTTRSFSIVDKSTGCYDQVLYNSSITDVDGEQAIYDLSTRALTYGNFGCTKVLPVELTGFSTVCSKNDVQIKWTTSSETNNDYFTLEKSTDLNTWDYVSTIKGAGNSNEIISYSYTDNSAQNLKLYYRLRQTDFDGASETFDPVGVLCNDSQSDYFTLNPNPAMNQVMCSIYATEESNAKIEISNYLGQLVYSQPYGLINGSNNFNLDVSQFQSGVYNIIIHLEEGSIIKTKNLVVQK
jgi:hypothetical protein